VPAADGRASWSLTHVPRTSEGLLISTRACSYAFSVAFRCSFQGLRDPAKSIPNCSECRGRAHWPGLRWTVQGRAQLRLVPASGAGRPGNAHSKGELFMDSAGALFVCEECTPGTWRKFTTTKI
jgi:hypothetical protein